MDWLNNNKVIIELVLSLISVVVAFIAIWISIATAKKQNKIALFEKRYQIYSRFNELIESAMWVSQDTLTPKGKALFWNLFFYGDDLKNRDIGMNIFAIKSAQEKKNIYSLEYKNLSKEKEIMIQEKYDIDHLKYASDKNLWMMSEVLFSKSIYTDMKDFFELYGKIVGSMNMEDDNVLDTLFKQWYSVCERLTENKILDRMKRCIVI